MPDTKQGGNERRGFRRGAGPRKSFRGRGRGNQGQGEGNLGRGGGNSSRGRGNRGQRGGHRIGRGRSLIPRGGERAKSFMKQLPQSTLEVNEMRHLAQKYDEVGVIILQLL